MFLLPLLGPESPLLQSPVLFLLPDARGYRLTEMPKRVILGNWASDIVSVRAILTIVELACRWHRIGIHAVQLEDLHALRP